jgi:sugar O-acyltransferase (sialic acid O-acetyltransferase NeuD family)
MNIVILGGGGHAAVIADAIETNGLGNIVGFLDDNPCCTLLKLPHLGPIMDLNKIPSNCHAVVLGVGNNRLREKWYKSARLRGLHCPSVIHPKSIISKYANIGESSVIMAGAIVQARSKIGLGAIVNTGALIDHDCVIGNFTHISPGVNIAGGVTIGDNCLLGIGSRVIPGKVLSNDILVAAGAVVVNDVSEGKRVAGIPAKIMRSNV